LIDYLPFRNNYFAGVSILEVLEHIPTELQKMGLIEANRILHSKGTLVVSVPYKEQILFTNCIHYYKDTALYGHLHSLDEDKINTLLTKKYFKLPDK
jgi:ubiquinone/menaquinone biosynthesis C-methylase UbiE